VVWWWWLACGGGGPAEPAGPLLYVQEVDGLAQTAVRRPASAEPTVLGGLPGMVYPGPADPQGTHALVVSAVDDEAGHRETLALVPLAGGAPLILAPPAEVLRQPSWSPDGTFLVFESSQHSFRDLYRVQRDGTGLTRLTDAPHGSFEPTVSPDGQRVLFASSRDGNAEIYVMGADGSAPQRLTQEPADDTQPAWFPDGRIGWLRQIGSSVLLFRMNADGSQAHVVRKREGPTLDLAWAPSPDGTRVAITQQTGPRAMDVVIVPLDGGPEVRLGGDGVDEMPAWSADGAWLAWTSAQTGDPEIFIATADGRVQRQLTTRPGPDWLPRWGPAAR
jgi:TolB protein